MNAARQLVTRRLATMGPRVTTPASRYASTHAHHAGQLSPRDRHLMQGIFTAATVATAGGVAYAAARSGTRMNNRFVSRDSKLDKSKWFNEGADVNTMLGGKH